MTSVVALWQELNEEVMKASTKFADRIYSIFSLEQIAQLMGQHGMSGTPFVATTYEKGTPVTGSKGTDARIPRQGDPQLVNVQFSVILGVDATDFGSNDDTKIAALGMFDEIRPRLQGFKGVNSRPWRFATEGPLSDSIDGVILYVQLWETIIVQQGKVT